MIDARPEFALDGIMTVGRIFDYIMQEGSGHGFRIHSQVRKDCSYRQRVHDVRLTGESALASVCLIGEAKGFANQRQIWIRHPLFGCTDQRKVALENQPVVLSLGEHDFQERKLRESGKSFFKEAAGQRKAR